MLEYSENGTGNGSVTLSENLTGLSAGVYSDNITITAQGAANSPRIVPVTLTVTSGGGSSFVYDGDGRRIRKTENGQTILYINQYFEKNLTTGEVITYYYMGTKLVSMRKGSTLMYVHQDHLTGTSLITDSAGAQVGATMKYYPFGGARSGYVPSDIKFTGQRLDDSGLYYFNARYYDPQIGRFISADTIVPGPFSSQSFNRYSYVLNNPLRYNDPTGYCGCDGGTICDAGNNPVNSEVFGNAVRGFLTNGGASKGGGGGDSYTPPNYDQSVGWAVTAANNLMGYTAFLPDGTANPTGSIPDRCGPRESWLPGTKNCTTELLEVEPGVLRYEAVWVVEPGTTAGNALIDQEGRTRDGSYLGPGHTYHRDMPDGIYIRTNPSRDQGWITAHESRHSLQWSLIADFEVLYHSNATFYDLVENDAIDWATYHRMPGRVPTQLQSWYPDLFPLKGIER